MVKRKTEYLKYTMRMMERKDFMVNRKEGIRNVP